MSSYSFSPSDECSLFADCTFRHLVSPVIPKREHRNAHWQVAVHIVDVITFRTTMGCMSRV
jgi:hypothetical protein